MSAKSEKVCGRDDRCELLGQRSETLDRRGALAPWPKIVASGVVAVRGQRAEIEGTDKATSGKTEYLGGVAQLEEHLTGSQEVVGSSPIASTEKAPGHGLAGDLQSGSAAASATILQPEVRRQT